jgi:NAD(P)-dependent dehydrogenase (short-subunit alcohol dehydrogenase family)
VCQIARSPAISPLIRRPPAEKVLQLRPYDINVNCIAPGVIWTARFAATRQTPVSEEGRSRLQRISQPEDLARVVEFRAGPLSEKLSGQVLGVSGALGF